MQFPRVVVVSVLEEEGDTDSHTSARDVRVLPYTLTANGRSKSPEYLRRFAPTPALTPREAEEGVGRGRRKFLELGANTAVKQCG